MACLRVICGLQGFLEADLHANDQADLKVTTPEERETDFFSNMPKSMIKRLYELYEVDFKMFGYGEYERYFQMGIEG